MNDVSGTFPPSPEARRHFFQDNGYLTHLTVLGPSELVTFRADVDKLETEAGRETMRIGLVDRHFEHDFLMRTALSNAVLDPVEEILGPDFLLLATHFFCKYGGDGKWVAWHQDATYWGLEPPVAITAWLAVDDSDVENGCMRVIPGSHRAGIREHGTASGDGNLLSINQELPVTQAEEASAVDLPLTAGTMSLHDGCLVHGSLPNVSGRRRCGLTLRFVPSTVRQNALNSHGGRWKPVVARGTGPTSGW